MQTEGDNLQMHFWGDFAQMDMVLQDLAMYTSASSLTASACALSACCFYHLRSLPCAKKVIFCLIRPFGCFYETISAGKQITSLKIKWDLWHPNHLRTTVPGHLNHSLGQSTQSRKKSSDLRFLPQDGHDNGILSVCGCFDKPPSFQP